MREWRKQADDSETHSEEMTRFQMDPQVFHRHDRPLFRRGGVGDPETGPEDDILVDDVGFLVDPFFQTEDLPTRVLVDVRARGVELVGGVGGHEHLEKGRERRWGFRIGRRGLWRLEEGRLTWCRAQGARFHTNDPGLQSSGGI